MPLNIYSFRRAFLFLCIFSFSLVGNAQIYVTSGDAFNLGGDCFRLTPEAETQAGAVWFQNKIDLEEDFEVQVELNFGDRNSNGADGMAFVLQPICNGIGGSGEGLGYLGINPSLAVEFDTWFNSNRNDPLEDHIALQRDGLPNHIAPFLLEGPVELNNIEDGNFHPTTIKWDATTQNLTVTFDGNLVINYNGDIVTDIFGGNSKVFWGFTAATGASINNQDVCIIEVEFKEEVPFSVIEASCPNASDGAIDLMITGGVGPFSYLWNTGDTTEDLNGIPAGTYTVEVTDGNDCISTFIIEVGFGEDTTPPEIISSPDAEITIECGEQEPDEAPVFEDNCGEVSISAISSIAMMDCGFDIERVWTATDPSGNSTSFSQIIHVVDTTAPEASDVPAPEVTIECGDPEPADMPSFSDTCDSELELTAISGINNITECGYDIERVWTATDDCGNSTSISQVIHVVDTQGPDLVCPEDVTVSCDSLDFLQVTGMPVATDLCDSDPLLTYEDEVVGGDCEWECTIKRTWTATDACGNISECEQTIVSTALELVGQALSEGPMVLGFSRHTLTLDEDDAACIIGWMPARDTLPFRLERGNQETDESCNPGTNPLDDKGKLTNPLLGEMIELSINLRLNPKLGDTPLSEIDCPIDPFLRQWIRPSSNPTVNTVHYIANYGLGNLIGPPVLDELLELIKCINGTYDKCEDGVQEALTERSSNIENFGTQDFKVFPNPAQNQIFVDLNEYKGKSAILRLYSLEGRLIQELQFDELPGAPLNIDLSNKIDGLYLLSVQVDGTTLNTKTFVLQKH